MSEFLGKGKRGELLFVLEGGGLAGIVAELFLERFRQHGEFELGQADAAGRWPELDQQSIRFDA
jgi:hypothetical protein